MSFEADLYEYIRTDPTFAFTLANRVRPGFRATSELDKLAIIYHLVSTRHHRHVGGGSGMRTDRYQFDIYDQTKSIVQLNWDLLRKRLDMNRHTMGSTFVHATYFETAFDEYIEPTNDSQKGLFKRSVDVIFWHEETVTSIAG